MIAAAALLALAAPLPAPPSAQPARAQARIMAFVRIIHAAEVRDGHTAEPHQRRPGLSPEGLPLTLIEFE